jgi:hypothetical protein
MVSGIDLIMGGAGGVESLLLNGAGLRGYPIAITRRRTLTYSAMGGRRTRECSSIC